MNYDLLFEANCGRTKGLCFHPSRPILIASTHTGSVLAYDLSLRSIVHTFSDHDGPVRGVSFSKHGDVFTSCGDDTQVRVFNFSKKQVVGSFNHTDYVRQAVFHDTHPLLLSCSDDQTLKLYNFLARKVVATATGHAHYVMSACFVDEFIVSGSLDGTVRVWDYHQVIGTQKIPGNIQKTDRLSKLLNLPKVSVKQIIEVHDRGVNCVSPIRGGFLSGSDDRTVRVFKKRGDTFVEVGSFFAHGNNVTAVHEFEGKIVSCGEDGLLIFHKHYSLETPKSTKKYGSQDSFEDDSETASNREGEVLRINKDTRFWCLASKGTLLAVGHDNGFTVYDFARPKILAPVDKGLFYVYGNELRFNDYTSEEVLTSKVSKCISLNAFRSIYSPHPCCFSQTSTSNHELNQPDNLAANGLYVSDMRVPRPQKCSEDSLEKVQVSSCFNNAVVAQYQVFFEVYENKKLILKEKGRGIISMSYIIGLHNSELNLYNRHRSGEISLHATLPIESGYTDILNFDADHILVMNKSSIAKYSLESKRIVLSTKIKNISKVRVHGDVIAAISSQDITFLNKRLGIIETINEMVPITDGFFECNRGKISRQITPEENSDTQNRPQFENNITKNLKQKSNDKKMFVFIYATQKHLMYAFYDSKIQTGVLKSLEKEIIPILRADDLLFYFSDKQVETTKVNFNELDLKLAISALDEHETVQQTERQNIQGITDLGINTEVTTSFHLNRENPSGSLSNLPPRTFNQNRSQTAETPDSGSFTPSYLFLTYDAYIATRKYAEQVINSGLICGQSIYDFISDKNQSFLLTNTEHVELDLRKNIQMNYLANKTVIDDIINKTSESDLTELATMAIKSCNEPLAEKILWKLRDFQRLFMLYAVTKNNDKLNKLLSYGDDCFKLSLSIFIGDVSCTKEILRRNGFYPDSESTPEFESIHESTATNNHDSSSLTKSIATPPIFKAFAVKNPPKEIVGAETTGLNCPVVSETPLEKDEGSLSNQLNSLKLLDSNTSEVSTPDLTTESQTFLGNLVKSSCDNSEVFHEGLESNLFLTESERTTPQPDDNDLIGSIGEMPRTLNTKLTNSEPVHASSPHSPEQNFDNPDKFYADIDSNTLDTKFGDISEQPDLMSESNNHVFDSTDDQPHEIHPPSHSPATKLYNPDRLDAFSDYIVQDTDLNDIIPVAYENITNGKFSKAVQSLKQILYTLTRGEIAQSSDIELRKTAGRYLGALIAEKQKKKIEDVEKIMYISYNFKNCAVNHKCLAYTNIMVILYRNNNYIHAKEIAQQIMSSESDFDTNTINIATKILKSKKNTNKHEITFSGSFCCDSLTFECDSLQCTWCFNHFKESSTCSICEIGYLKK